MHTAQNGSVTFCMPKAQAIQTFYNMAYTYYIHVASCQKDTLWRATYWFFLYITSLHVTKV